MRVLVTLAALTLSIAGCTILPPRIETPTDLIGEVSNPVFTGWYIDHCNGDGLTKELPRNCIQVGGELYKVMLRNVRAPQGESQSLIIAFPAHALSSEYRARVRIHLVKAPDAFARETGITYFASEWNDA
jgi:hypothetical protein